MIVKPLDPIADIGASSAVRRNAQRSTAAPAAEAPQSAAFPQLGGSAPEEQPQPAAAAAQPQNQKQAEAEPQTQSHPKDPSIRFHVDKDTGKTIAELVDTEGQVLRQVPTEEALEIAKAIGKLQGMFVDLKV